MGALPPHHAPLPLRAGRVFGGPVDHAAGCCKAVRCLLLPTLVGPPRPQQVSAMLGPTRQAGVGGHITRIDQVFPRGQLAGRQVRLHGRQDRTIRGRGRGGRHLGEEVGCLLGTGFGDLYFVARPVCLALCALPGFWVIGRAEQPWRRGQFLRAAPASWVARRGRIALLPPPLPPELDGGHLPSPGGGGGLGDGPQPLVAGRANVRGQRIAGWPLRRQALGRTPPTIAIAPRRRDPGLPPRWRGSGPHVQGRAQRCADAREAIAGLDSGQDMRRVGAWPAWRFAEPRLAPPCHHRLAQEERGMAGEQALAARAQDGGLAARGAHIQGQGIFPVHPRPDRIRRLRVREPRGTRPHGDARELGRGVRRPPGMRKERATGRGRREGPARIAPPYRGIPLGERGAGSDLGRLLVSEVTRSAPALHPSALIQETLVPGPASLP